MPLSSRHEINRQIRLRVVREFNLPDPVADMLERCCRLPDQGDEPAADPARPSPSRPAGRAGGGRTATLPRPAPFGPRCELPAVVPAGEFRFGSEPESGSCSDGHLSDIMPDVAMATATLGQMQLQEQQEMELDLGDGTVHLHTQGLPNPMHHPVGYRRYPPGTYPHHRSDSQSYHTPMPRFL